MTDSAPSRDGMPAKRCPGHWSVFLLALLGAGLALQLQGGVQFLRDQSLSRRYTVVLGEDLRSDASSLFAVADSVAARAAMARLWVRWANRKDVAGSGQLVDGLRQMILLPDPGLEGRAVEDLAASGRLHLVRDPRVRFRALRLYRESGAARVEAEAEHRRFVHRMASLLPPGTWQHVFQRPDSVQYPVEFVPSLDQLLNGGFEGDLRTEARNLELYEARLRDLAQEATSLREILLAGTGGS